MKKFLLITLLLGAYQGFAGGTNTYVPQSVGDVNVEDNDDAGSAPEALLGSEGSVPVAALPAQYLRQNALRDIES